jgi:hypothetical protein
MLWALLFSIILGKNDPVFIFPKLDKHAKEHVTEEVRADRIIELRKTSEKKRKKYRKYKTKFDKKFRKLNSKKLTTLDDFKKLMAEHSLERKSFQEVEINSILEAKELITTEEWQLIITDGQKQFEKSKEQILKEQKRIARQKAKTLKLIDGALKMSYPESTVDSVIVRVFNTFDNYLTAYYSLFESENSIIFNTTISREKLENEVNRLNQMYDKIYLSMIESHFILKKETSSQDWEKIMKRTNKI